MTVLLLSPIPYTDREQQMQAWLFSALRAINGAIHMSQREIREFLSHCLTARNPAVVRRAAQALREISQ